MDNQPRRFPPPGFPPGLPGLRPGPEPGRRIPPERELPGLRVEGLPRPAGPERLKRPGRAPGPAPDSGRAERVLDCRVLDCRASDCGRSGRVSRCAPPGLAARLRSKRGRCSRSRLSSKAGLCFWGCSRSRSNRGRCEPLKRGVDALRSKLGRGPGRLSPEGRGRDSCSDFERNSPGARRSLRWNRSGRASVRSGLTSRRGGR